VSGIWLDGTVCAAVHLPTAAIVVVVVLGAVQFALFIWALIDLIRRPRPALLPRWAWLVIIILVEFLGSIVYLAVGRGEPPVTDAPPGGGIGSAGELDESRAQRAVDMLYGTSQRSQAERPGTEAVGSPGRTSDSTQPSPSSRAFAGAPETKPSQWASPDAGRQSSTGSPPAEEDPAGRGGADGA
jgi:hypothetical protein